MRSLMRFLFLSSPNNLHITNHPHDPTTLASHFLLASFLFTTVPPWLGALFMSTPAFRLMLRHTRFVARSNTSRYASTTSETVQAASNTAAKSKEAVSNMTSKASEGLSRVTSSAGPALSGAAQRVNGVQNSIGGRTASLIAFGPWECSS